MEDKNKLTAIFMDGVWKYVWRFKTGSKSGGSDMYPTWF